MRISRKAKALGVSATLVLALGGGALVLGGGTALAACTPSVGQACSKVNVTVQSTGITLALTESSIALNPVGNTEESFNAVDAEQWTVTTNDASGYHLLVIGDSGSSAFVNSVVPADTIPDSDLQIQTSVNGTGGFSDYPEYTSNQQTLPAGDVGTDSWFINTANPVPSGTYNQQFDYEALQI